MTTALTRPSGIPLRPDPSAREADFRRSLLRSITTLVQGNAPQAKAGQTEKLLRMWSNDAQVERIMKSATSQTTSADFPQMVVVRTLPLLSPSSVAAALLSLCHSIDVTGITGEVKIPYIGKTGEPPPIFVGESKPIPVDEENVKDLTIGSLKGIKLIAVMTNEMQSGSGNTAATLIGNVLNKKIRLGLDAVMLSNAPGDALKPPGLLNGLTPIASAGGTGEEGAADDFGLLAEAIAASDIDTSKMIYIMTPKLAKKAVVYCEPEFFKQNTILQSSKVAAGTIIGLVPDGLAIAYSGTTRIETSKQGTLQMDTAPTDGGPVAGNTKSMTQTDSFALRVVASANWAVHPDGISVIEGAAW
jgi:hypothetical protein